MLNNIWIKNIKIKKVFSESMSFLSLQQTTFFLHLEHLTLMITKKKALTRMLSTIITLRNTFTREFINLLFPFKRLHLGYCKKINKYLVFKFIYNFFN